MSTYLLRAFFYGVLAMLLALTISLALHTHPKGLNLIVEDDPAWNCHTMGNHVCGEDTP